MKSARDNLELKEQYKIKRSWGMVLYANEIKLKQTRKNKNYLR